ncbi:ATP-binding protein [Bailinhaonella thermotolerans]|uniref:ATP-binding protein n=1 Tax=Bailinhaonella thermotolerans TaxID=1070861 RepID=A0A3A4AD27_9ACTN|nr:ATP-binding protein [Bailinhaonella thermotolerans]RJL23960.1 ATP-binding protein [Bailinhaonella thermotolerans]
MLTRGDLALAEIHLGQLGQITVPHCQVHVTVWCLPPDRGARRARHLLRAELTDYVTDPETLDDLSLIVGELAANAYQHGAGPCEMRIVRHGGVPVACEIADAGPGLEAVATYLQHPAEHPAVGGLAEIAAGGRGLAIVAELTNGLCGVRTTRLFSTGSSGKSVWFVIPNDQVHAAKTTAAPGLTPGSTSLPVQESPGAAVHHSSVSRHSLPRQEDKKHAC